MLGFGGYRQSGEMEVQASRLSFEWWKQAGVMVHPRHLG